MIISSAASGPARSHSEYRELRRTGHRRRGNGRPATLDGDEHCSTGASTGRATSVARTTRARPEPRRGARGLRRGTEALSGGIVARFPWDHVRRRRRPRPAHGAELRDHLRERARVGRQRDRGCEGRRDLVINRNFAWSGPVAGIGRRRRPHRLRRRSAMGQDLRRRRTEADHPLSVPGPRPGQRSNIERRITSAGRRRYLDRRDYRGECWRCPSCTAPRCCSTASRSACGSSGQPRSPHSFDRSLREAAVFRSMTPATSASGAGASTASWPTRRSTLRAVMDDEAIVHEGGGGDRHDPRPDRGRARGHDQLTDGVRVCVRPMAESPPRRQSSATRHLICKKGFGYLRGSALALRLRRRSSRRSTSRRCVCTTTSIIRRMSTRPMRPWRAPTGRRADRGGHRRTWTSLPADKKAVVATTAAAI